METENKVHGVCPHCNKTVLGRKKKFCTTTCRTRFYALRQYKKNKNNPQFKAQRKAYFSTWRVENKDKWNALMRVAAKKYQQKKRAEFLAKEAVTKKEVKTNA